MPVPGTTCTSLPKGSRHDLFSLLATSSPPVEEWAAKNGATRSAAIRRLIELALPGSDPTKQTSPRAAAKASGLAADQIDKLANPAMPTEERRAPKRR
jgi:hypothetical protein